ncbi:MAG: YkvA family protein [Pseudomonadota bacterium]
MSQPPPRFAQYLQRAGRMLGSPGRVQNVLARVVSKLATSKGGIAELKASILLLVDLLRAWLSGEYRSVERGTLVAVLAALIYFVVPLDLVPDFLFGWGFVDDIAVITYVLNQIGHELEAFKTWREQNTDTSDESPQQ